MTEVERDRYGRPLIIPPGGGKPVPYVRTSKMAGVLDDTFNLMQWQNRMTALGLVKRPDLMLKLQGIVASHDDPIEDFAAKKALNVLTKEAQAASGANDAARRGDGLHMLTEALDGGKPLPAIDDEWQVRLDEYKVATADLEVLSMEMFVVNDELGCAGSFDRLYGFPNGAARIGDLKTGSSDASYPLKVCIQEAIYANSMLYDPATGERSPIHYDIDVTEGVLVHMPSKFPEKGTKVYSLDLVKGYEAARLAAQVAAVRKWKADSLRQELHFDRTEAVA